MIDEALVVLYVIGAGTWIMLAISSIGAQRRAAGMVVIAAIATFFAVVWHAILVKYEADHILFVAVVPVEMLLLSAAALFLRRFEHKALYADNVPVAPKYEPRSPYILDDEPTNFVLPEPTPVVTRKPREPFESSRSWLDVKWTRMRRQYASRRKSP